MHLVSSFIFNNYKTIMNFIDVIKNVKQKKLSIYFAVLTEKIISYITICMQEHLENT